MLGDALFNLDRIEEAKARYLEAIRLRPNDPAYRNSFGVNLAIKKDFTAAMEQFQEALRIAPNYLETYENIGIMLKRQGKLAEAESYFEKAKVLEREKPSPK